MDELLFNKIIKSQTIFADLWIKQQQAKRIAHNQKMTIARAEKRLLNPISNPYRKSYFTRNVFEQKFSTKKIN